MKILTDIQVFKWLNFTHTDFICVGTAQTSDNINFYKGSFNLIFIEETACGECPHILERIIISDHLPNLY